MHEILLSIVETKKRKVNILKKNREGFISLVKKAPPVVSFKEAINRKGKISFIAEIKQASPSKGVLRKNFSHLDLADSFKKAKVDAISVVTEQDFFLGKISYIEDIRKKINLPILRKDFIFDEVQILESRAVGADAILLIMGILHEEQVKKLYAFAKDLGMDVLVEVHTEKELKKVIKIGVDIIGINSRNLHTFQVSLERVKNLSPFVPEDVIKVAESGINSLKDVLLLKGLGADALLVGETLMKADNPTERIQELHVDV